MSTSFGGPERSDPTRWKSWAKLSIALSVLIAVLVFFSPSFHDKHFGVAQNESAAVGSLRKLNSLESQYAAAHADKGFACELALLQPTEEIKDAFGPYATLLTGVWSGYKFAIVGCAPGASGVVIHYAVTAVPVTPHATGVRAFCTDESGDIFYEHTGSGPECLTARQVLF